MLYKHVILSNAVLSSVVDQCIMQSMKYFRINKVGIMRNESPLFGILSL